MTPSPSPASGAAHRPGYRVPLGRPRRAHPPVGTKVVKRGTSSGWSLLGVLLILLALTLYALGEWVWGVHTGPGLIAAPILLTVSFFALRRPVEDEAAFDLGGLLLTAIGLRLLLAYVRFVGARDAVVYDQEGARLAESFRRLEFIHVDVGAGAPVPGTGSLRYIAGLAHTLTGSNFFASFLVFTFMSFAGCFLFYRAFVTAVPDGDHRRYAFLLFLWPSLMFWPSSMGKDSWMVFCGGMAVLGAAKLFDRVRGGYLILGLGLGLAALVRPHVSLLLFAAIAAGFLIGRRNNRRIPGQFSLAGLTKVIGILILVVGAAVLAPTTARFLKVDSLSSDGVSTAITDTQAHTGGGGSAFQPANPNSPIGYPIAVVTVLFRPLPGEVGGLSALASSAEGLALVVLVAAGWRRIWTAFRRLRENAFVTMATAYIAMFAYAFAAIANFGILARERVQLLPMLFIVLALRASRRVTDESGRTAVVTTPTGVGAPQ